MSSRQGYRFDPVGGWTYRASKLCYGEVRVRRYYTGGYSIARERTRITSSVMRREWLVMILGRITAGTDHANGIGGQIRSVQISQEQGLQRNRVDRNQCDASRQQTSHGEPY